MKKIVSLLLVLCIVLSLSACKSKQQQADDYVGNNEYKKAYDILYELDDDHSRADDCLVRWCKYCIDKTVVDQQLSEVKVLTEENAAKILKMLVQRYADKENMTLEQCNVCLNVMTVIENFYQSNQDYITLKTKIKTIIMNAQDEETINNFINEEKYNEAYQYAYQLDEDHSRADDVLIKWYGYCLGNGNLDEQIQKIEITTKELALNIYDKVIETLQIIQTPNKQQCEAALKIIDNLKDYLDDSETGQNKIITSLNHNIKGDYFWTIPNQSTLSYKDYYSTVHYYDKSDLNSSSVEAKLNYYGFEIAKYNSDKSVNDIVYCIYGDYNSNTLFAPLGSVGYCFDGYWLYYVDRDNLAIYRMSIYGKTQEIIKKGSQSDISSGYYGFVLDSDVLYCYGLDKDGIAVVFRVYLPEMKVERFKTSINSSSTFTLFIPNDSEHLSYHGANTDYSNKVEELKKDKEALYALISKYYDIDKNQYDSYTIDEEFAWYSNQIEDSIIREYNILPYCYGQYDIKNKKEVLTPTKDSYNDPYK